MTMRAAAVVVLATLSCSEPPTGPAAPVPAAELERPGPISYTSLAEGDEIRVRLHYYGCYHDGLYTLTFRRVGDSMVGVTTRVAVTTRLEPRGWLEAQPAIVAEPQPAIVADTVIGPRELAGLERELADYRRPSKGNCTSVRDLELGLYRNGALLRRERYHVGDCRFFFEEAPPVTMISLAQRES